MNIAKRLFYKVMSGNTLMNNFLTATFKKRFSSSAHYWENRYKNNGNSGDGSYGEKAIYKAGILNKFVKENKIKKVIDFGCGDGNQLSLLHFPEYIGLDVSSSVIEKCIKTFSDDQSKIFFVYRNSASENLESFQAELVLSLDVIYHLLEDSTYENYMQQLFSFSFKYVIIYAWDVEQQQRAHVKHRKFSEWITANMAGWQVLSVIKNNSIGACDFYIYENKKS